MPDRRLLVGLAVAALVLAASGVAVAATTTTTVACTSDGTTLSCPIPRTTVTVRTTATATKTATATVPGPTTTITTTPPAETTTTTSEATVSATPGAFPDATNTGVPAGVTLTPYTGTVNSSGDCVLQTANQVIDGQTLNCNVLPRASGIVIKNSKVNGIVWLDTDNSASTGWSFTLQDTEVAGGYRQLAAVCCGNSTVVRSNIHGGQTAVQCEETATHPCSVTDSWLHGQLDGPLKPNDTYHLGGFLSDGSSAGITLKHNTIVCDVTPNSGGGCTGDIQLIPNFAPISGATIQNNMLGANMGSAFCTYGGEKSTSATPHSDHIVYQDNVFQRGSNSQCAAYRSRRQRVDQQPVGRRRPGCAGELDGDREAAEQHHRSHIRHTRRCFCGQPARRLLRRSSVDVRHVFGQQRRHVGDRGNVFRFVGGLHNRHRLLDEPQRRVDDGQFRSLRGFFSVHRPGGVLGRCHHFGA
jgi:hypothetical protein